MRSTRFGLQPGKQTMILLVLTLILTTQHSLSEIPALTFKDGRCQYDDRSLSEGGSLRLGEPCVRLRCKVSKKRLVVNGCPPPTKSEDPDDPPNVLYWPYCCKTK
ncbi:uncharacterized protein LOC142591117 [Dermacentor variabilis]|uniref:uncharacterized protein LOC142591117 n=1 Tax=Dermacentor variabilis TaxID=34621 RepID=UPI003F5B250B